MNKLKYITSLVLTVTLLFSCEQSLEELNIDPNNPSQATPELVLPAGVMSSASVIGGRFSIIGGIWSQYYTQNNSSNQYKDVEAFYITPSDFAALWQELYAGSLNDLKYVKESSKASENWSAYLMATVIEAYTYQAMADIFGDIPFSEALLGDKGNTTPHFDDASAIYDSLIERIDYALEKNFTVGTVKDMGKADLVFGPHPGADETPLATDIDKWIRFANTLKLKIYLRQTNARPSVASAGIQALYADGAKFLTEDAAIDRFEDVASKSNPFYEQDQRQLNTATNLKASLTLFSILDENDDPRLDVMYVPGKDGGVDKQKPMNQGDFNAPSTVLDPLTVSRAKLSATDPVYFISKAESYFLQAEAALRGWGTGDAHSLYNEGVVAAFEQAGSTAAVAADFTAPGGNYEYGEFYDGTELGSIIVQKWMSMATTYQGFEAFIERTRTGYPIESLDDNGDPLYHSSTDYIDEGHQGQIVYPKEGTTSGAFAMRFFYPNTEVSRNPNTPTQSDLTDPLWYQAQ